MATPRVLAPAVSGLPLSGTDYNNNLAGIEASFLDVAPFVISGLIPAIAGNQLAVTVSAGVAVVGAAMSIPALTIGMLSPSATNDLYLLQNGTGVSLPAPSTAPANSVKLGQATTGPGTVTSINTNQSSGRQQWVQQQNLILGGPGAGNPPSQNLASWNATAGDGFSFYGVLPAGAVPASFSGDVTLTPATTARNVVQPTANAVPLTLKSFGGASDELQFRDSSNNLIASVDQTGQVWTGANSSTGAIFIGSNKLAIQQNAAFPFQLQAQAHFTTPSGILAAFGGNAIAGRALVCYSNSTTDQPLMVNGFAGQTGDLFQIADSSGNVELSFTNGNTQSCLRIRQGTNQASGNFFEVRDFTNVTITDVNFSGDLEYARTSSTTHGRRVGALTGSFASNVDASRTGRMTLIATDFNGDRNVLIAEADGTQPLLGVGGATTANTALTVHGATLLSRAGAANPAVPAYLTITAGADTALAAGVEANDVLWSLNRTQQWATGALTTQRAFWVRQPTYGFVGASVITTGATVAIEGAPVAGTNATITTPLALWVQAGNVLVGSGTISCPGAGTSSERFGSGSLSAGSNSTAAGSGASASGNQATALGYGAVSSNHGSVSAGYLASASGDASMAIGYASTANASHSHAFGATASVTGASSFAFGVASIATGTNAIAFGEQASAGFSNTVVFGPSMSATAANQFVVGTISDTYIGNGVTNAAPGAVIYHATGGSGSNIAGASMTLAGGQSTGNAAGGSVLFQTSPAGVSGTGLNALATVASMLSTGQVAIGSQTPTALLHIAAGAAGAGLSPLKLTSGPLLTATEAGTHEFLTPTFYLTPVTTRRAISLASNGVTADTTVSNSVTETTLFTGTVAANEMGAGKTFRTRVYGRFSGLVTDTFTLRFKVGGTTFLSLTSTGVAVTNQEWSAEFVVTCRTTGAAGTVISQVWAIINNAIFSASDTGTHTVDTTAAENVTVTGQWSASSASDSLTVSQGYLELVGG